MQVGHSFMEIVPLSERDERSQPLGPKGMILAPWVCVAQQDALPLCVSFSLE